MADFRTIGAAVVREKGPLPGVPAMIRRRPEELPLLSARGMQPGKLFAKPVASARWPARLLKPATRRYRHWKSRKSRPGVVLQPIASNSKVPAWASFA